MNAIPGFHRTGASIQRSGRLAYPALELQRKVNYAPILTARGCPFSCAYCASRFLTPERMRRSAESVLDEISLRHKDQDVRDFAWHDDAFLSDSENHAAPILEGIIRSGYRLRFHPQRPSYSGDHLGHGPADV